MDDDPHSQQVQLQNLRKLWLLNKFQMKNFYLIPFHLRLTNLRQLISKKNLFLLLLAEVFLLDMEHIYFV